MAYSKQIRFREVGRSTSRKRTLMRLRIRDLDELSRTRAETDRIRAQANYARALL